MDQGITTGRERFLKRALVLFVLAVATVAGVAAWACSDPDYWASEQVHARWRSGPAITYCVDYDIEKGTAANTRKLEIARSVVAHAAAAWAPAVPIAICEATSGDADIEIHFVPASDEHLRARELGEARTTFAPESGTLVHAVCWIDAELAPAALQHTATHELGHALGLEGHSPDEADVLYPECRQPIGTVTARDLATMRKLYE